MTKCHKEELISAECGSYGLKLKMKKIDCYQKFLRIYSNDVLMLMFNAEAHRKRLKVLERALLIEGLVSNFLANLLDIDPANSKTFGNSSSSLSFNSKILLLADTKSIAKEESKKFIYFMNIRNQFMHNIEAESFVSCIGFIDGLGTALLKLYPQDGQLDIEEKFERCFDNLVYDLFKSLGQIAAQLNNKLKKDAASKVNAKAVEILLKSIADTTRKFDEFIDDEIANTKDEKIKYYKGIGREFERLITIRALKLFDEDQKSEDDK